MSENFYLISEDDRIRYETKKYFQKETSYRQVRSDSTECSTVYLLYLYQQDELKKNIHVRYTKSTMLDKIVTAAAQNEIYDLVKVDYSIKDSTFDTRDFIIINI